MFHVTMTGFPVIMVELVRLSVNQHFLRFKKIICNINCTYFLGKTLRAKVKQNAVEVAFTIPLLKILL